MEQKQVTLIGIRAENHGIIKAVELTPDLLQKRLVLISGNVGNGKSTLIDLCKTAIAGTDAIKKKDTLESGYLAEAQLIDGDVKLYVGAKVSQYQRGDKAGLAKFETFLFAKDANGKEYQPIIDGVAATPSDYVKMLTTELTFSLPDLFSENQATHRKLIEKLFKPELDKMKIEDVMARIEEAKKQRDIARTLCQANGAFMERFEDEGYNENKLELLNKIDLKEIEDKRMKLILEKDRKVNASDSAWELEKNKIDTARKDALQKITDTAQKIKDEIRKDKEEKDKKYNELHEEYLALKTTNDSDRNLAIKIKEEVSSLLGEKNEGNLTIQSILDETIQYLSDSYPKEPTKPTEDPAMLKKIEELKKDYAALNNTPLVYPEKANVNTEDIDKAITALDAQKESANLVNQLYNRYQLWKDWIEAKGKYEKEIDVLRKLYAAINTGVEGMNIVPVTTESGRIEVWIKYNGEYDTQYFSNPNKEFRYMFEYSSFQRTIIGLMLQAARLNLKPKALRIAFVDDVAFTPKDVSVLQNIAEKLDLKLITAWTHEADKDTLIDGQILIEGGEVFF